MTAITNEIEKLTTGRVRNAQKKLDDVTAHLNKVRSEITKLGVAIKTAERYVASFSYAYVLNIQYVYSSYNICYMFSEMRRSPVRK